METRDAVPTTCCRQFYVLLLALGVVLTISGSTILTPLWLDAINNETNNTTNSTVNPVKDYHQNDAYANIFITNLVFLVLTAMYYIYLKCTHQFSAADYEYPQSHFFYMGLADSVSSCCFVFASSGDRTAPYLQAIAGNFAIPVTFFVR